MTTSVRTSVPSEQPSRRIIGWRDDQVELVASTGDKVEVFPWAATPFGAEDVPAGTLGALMEVPVASTTMPEEHVGVVIPVTEAVDIDPIRHRNIRGSLSGLWADHLVTNCVQTLGTAATTSSWIAPSGAEPDWVFLAPVIAGLVEHHDFYSSALPELAQIEVTIESINETIRESVRSFVSAYVRDHGHAYYVAAEDDAEPTGLAYTDHLGDYPPLERVWEDVEVVIGTEDEIEQRSFTDEDHQVWRI